jgi:hypothetical protein
MAAWSIARSIVPSLSQVPQPEHQAAQFQEVCAPHSQAPAPIDERLEIADQMAPAQLVPRGRQFQVGAMAVRGHNPALGIAQQLAQRRAIPTGRHSKESGNRRDHGPQPAPLAGFFPAGLVDVAAVGLLSGRVDGVIDGCQGGAALLLQGHYAPEADGQSKEIVQQARQHAITEMVVAMQNRDGGGGAWARLPSGCRRGAPRAAARP